MRRATEEVLFEIELLLGITRRFVQVQCRDPEHLTSTFAIARCDDWRVHVNETAGQEEIVNRTANLVAHAGDRSECVGAWAQVRDGAQEFERGSLLLQWVRRRI